MSILVTGSSGHLGEALVRVLSERGAGVVGVDRVRGAFTNVVGSIADRESVARAVRGVTTVYHAATLHKPHVESHSREAFVETNVRGTLILLEESVKAGVRSFVFTSTTSAFGDALRPAPGLPAAWITEAVVPSPKNIYGVTKVAAEDLCQLFHRNEGLSCIVLRTSRFFPEEDDDPAVRAAFGADNAKANEFLFRRVDIEDVVSAHLIAAQRAREIGFGKFIVSATTPFRPEDAARLREDAPAVLGLRVPGHEAGYARLGWRMFPAIDRVYDNAKARRELGWTPKWDFETVLRRLRETGDIRSPLARLIGEKGYRVARLDRE
jgi:nucleoside-diphosphate-sugar epimerase